jgi:hypothetical protein
MAKNPRIATLKNEIDQIKSHIEMRKKSIASLKSDKAKIADRYKGQIDRADKKDKAKLRDRKKHEVDNLAKQALTLKRTIEDYKKQILRKREEMKKLK